MKKNTFSITTPIYHLNVKPHLGNAFPTIAAGILARFKRIQGKDIFFLTGTGEHGEKIVLKAIENNKKPKEWTDEMAAYYELTWDRLEISYNKFIRTTDKKHKKIVGKVLEILKKKNLIYKEKYYFFRLSAFQNSLIKLIENEEIKIEPEKRRKEVIKFLAVEKLRDIAISREKIKWAIPLPWDSNQTVYPFFDALISCLTGFGWGGNLKKWPKYWPADCQIIGEDALKFHTLIWLAILLSLEAPLPRLIFIHGFLTLPFINLDKMIDTFGAEAVRYLLFSTFSFEEGGEVSLEKFYDKYNADLVNGYGNLFSRVLSLLCEIPGKRNVKFREIDKNFKEKIEFCWGKYIKTMEKLKFNQSLEIFKELIIFCDKYIDKEKPWNFSKNESGRFEKVLYNLIETLRHLSLMMMPFMPEKADQAFESLGILDEAHKKSLDEAQKWAVIKEYKIKKNFKKLFPKL